MKYPSNAINHNSKASYCLRQYEKARIVLNNEGVLFRVKYSELMLKLGVPETVSLEKLIGIWGLDYTDNEGNVIELLPPEVWESATTLRDEAVTLYKALMVKQNTEMPTISNFMTNAKQQIKDGVGEKIWKPTPQNNIDKPNKSIIYKPELNQTNEGSKLIHNSELLEQLRADGYEDTSEESQIVMANIGTAMTECKNGVYWD